MTTSSDRAVLAALRRRRRARRGLVELSYMTGGAVLGQVVARVPWGTHTDSTRTVQLLAGISAGLLTLIGIVTSLMFLVAQFAMTSQSPRLNLFRRDRLVVHCFGLLAGNLLFDVSAALAAIQMQRVSIAVPVTAIALLLFGLVMLRYVQVSAFRAVQLSPILHQIAHRGRASLDAIYPPRAVPDSEPAQSVDPPSDGRKVRWHGQQTTLRQVDMPSLVRVLRDADASVFLTVIPGDLIREESVIMVVKGAVDEKRLVSLLDCGIERTFDQDPTFAFRLLADIGLRAMSTAVNDPATVAQTIDEIEGLLRALISRDLDIGRIWDDDGRLRVEFTAITWDEYVHRAFDELIDSSGPQPSVCRQLRDALDRLISIAPPARVDVLISRRTALSDPHSSATPSC